MATSTTPKTAIRNITLAHARSSEKPDVPFFTFLWSSSQQKYFVFFFSECDYS